MSRQSIQGVCSTGGSFHLEPIRKEVESEESVVNQGAMGGRRACGHRIIVEPPIAAGRATRSTVWDYLDLWEWDGTIARIHDVLYVETRERAGREASPTMAILDAQSAKGALKGGLRSTARATTPARRSSGASVTSSSTRRACS